MKGRQKISRLLVTYAYAAALCIIGISVNAGPVHEAAAKGDIILVRALLTGNSELVNSQDENGASPLHWAADKNQQAVAEFLLANKADVNARKKNGVTPLHVAVALGRKEIVELLIANGADINAQDNIGRTPIICAKKNGQIAITKLLIARGKTKENSVPAMVNSVSQAIRSPNIGSATSYSRTVVLGCPINLIYVNLNDPRVSFHAAIAEGGAGTSESFNSFISRFDPTAAINGTFFCKTTWLPVGDIVINGRLAYFGGMGTGLCITNDNRVNFVAVNMGHHMDWSGYKTVICCGPRLVTNGRVTVNPEAEGFHDPHVLGIGMRTAVGVTDRNRLLLLNTRKGCSLMKLAGIMKELDCVDAMNLDGGASTAMYYQGKTISTPGRQLTNVLLVYSR